MTLGAEREERMNSDRYGSLRVRLRARHDPTGLKRSGTGRTNQTI